MTRPHPLALILSLTLLATVTWLNTCLDSGSRNFEGIFGIPSPIHSYGWPFRAEYPYKLPFLANLFCNLALIALPSFALHSLLRRTLQIHLATALLLMLTTSALLALNLRAETVVLDNPFARPEHPMRYSFTRNGWPQTFAQSSSNFIDAGSGMVTLPGASWSTPALLANVLIALALLSAVALVSELLLTRRTAPREATP